MALNICLDCTTAYAAGVECCPHCGSSEWAEEGTDMAKISRHGGPSYVGAPGPELVLPPASNEERESAGTGVAMEGVEAPADGTEHELVVEDEAVPAGTVDEVITWTEADSAPPARLNAALAAEQARPTPRVTLVAELERRLAQI